MEARLELVQTVVQKRTHELYDWTIGGTLENITKADEFLKAKGVAGLLIGGCTKRKLPRKDIDIIIKQDSGINYRELGIDWWFYDSNTGIAKNVNGITLKRSQFKQVRDLAPGLYLHSEEPYKYYTYKMKGGEFK
jgi:hypothetical protein